jgi:hypothetical protein
MNSFSSLTFLPRFIRRLPRLHKCLFGICFWMHCVASVLCLCRNKFLYFNLHNSMFSIVRVDHNAFYFVLLCKWKTKFLWNLRYFNYHALHLVLHCTIDFHWIIFFARIEELKVLVIKTFWFILQTNKFKWRHI